MYTLVAKDWKELSKAASEERDPKKFMDLIDQLNDALERHYGVDEAASKNSEQKLDSSPQLRAA
jgi:hypothetical protein